MNTLKIIGGNFKKQVSLFATSLRDAIVNQPFYALILLFLLSLIAIIVWMATWADNFPSWVGFGAYDEEKLGPRAKTLWDWLELLIIPLFLAVSVIFVNRAIQKREKLLAQDELREQALQNYLYTIQDLLLNHGLYKAGKRNDVRFVAMAHTDNIWRQLDPKRKGMVFDFLLRTDLIQCQLAPDWTIQTSETESRPVIAITKADLSGIVLPQGLWGSPALKNIYLVDVDLTRTNLRKVDFSGGVLQSCWFHETDLEEADFSNCDLRGSVFLNANLKGADMHGANLQGTVITKEQLESIASLEGCIMFDGSEYDPSKSMDEQDFIYILRKSLKNS